MNTKLLFPQQVLSWAVLQYWASGHPQWLRGVSLGWWLAVVLGGTSCSQSRSFIWSQRRKLGTLLMKYDFCMLLSSVLLKTNNEGRDVYSVYLWLVQYPVLSVLRKKNTKKKGRIQFQKMAPEDIYLSYSVWLASRGAITELVECW